MAKRNISKDSIKKVEEQATVIENPTEVEEPVKGSITTGVVVNCSKLNVRKTPNINSSVSGIINLNDKVKIDDDKSTDEFYKVRTESGLKGFCMKKYIKIKS